MNHHSDKPEGKVSTSPPFLQMSILTQPKKKTLLGTKFLLSLAHVKTHLQYEETFFKKRLSFLVF